MVRLWITGARQVSKLQSFKVQIAGSFAFVFETSKL
jgi:hypothetical protein